MEDTYCGIRKRCDIVLHVQRLVLCGQVIRLHCRDDRQVVGHVFIKGGGRVVFCCGLHCCNAAWVDGQHFMPIVRQQLHNGAAAKYDESDYKQLHLYILLEDVLGRVLHWQLRLSAVRQRCCSRYITYSSRYMLYM